MNRIKNFFEHQECPNVNGIIYPDGQIQLINVDVNWNRNKKYLLQLGGKTSIVELKRENTLSWNDCAILSTENYVDNDIEILAGEGDYGSDGFIAVINSINHELIWLAFFDCSNPFSRTQLNGEKLYAWSTNGTLWQFNLKLPEKIVISEI